MEEYSLEAQYLFFSALQEQSQGLFFYNNVNNCSIKITNTGGANQSKSTRERKKQKTVKETNLYVSEQVVEEILVRFPVKSLLRFKSVSKTWLSLIRSRYFIDSHIRHQYSRYHDSDELFVTSHDGTNKSFLDDDPSPSSSSVFLPPEITRFENDEDGQEGCRCVVRTMGPTSNGVYCLVSTFESNDGRVSILTGKIAFFNPATHDYKYTSSFPSSEYSLLSDLARKPCRIRYGFGASSDKDYKVVVVISWGPCFSSFLSFVYSLRSDKWTKVVDYEHDKRGYQEPTTQYPEITQDLELCPQRLLNGSWHWMGVNHDGSCSVLSFNLDDDVFYSFAAPGYTYNLQGDPTSEDEFGGAMSLVLNHHLAAIFFTNPCSFIDVWMMMEYGAVDSWTKIYAIQPNFDGAFSRLVGISLQPPPSDDNDNDNNGGTRIQRILFEDRGSKKLITLDDFGYYIEDKFYDFSSAIWWNTLGISTKVDTLEPLQQVYDI